MPDLPKKITPDAIREALFEVRFDHTELREVVVGTLAGSAEWVSFSKSRLASGEVPEQIREAEPSLRYLPSIELRSASGGELIRVGSHVVSHHIVGSYIGWDSFLPKLLATVEIIGRAVPSVVGVRFGLRYINALTPEDHFVGSVYDLAVRLEVAGRAPSAEVQLAYRVDEPPDLTGMVRVLSPSFVDGDIPSATTALIDVDISCDRREPGLKRDSVESWLERAHDAEKRAFFSLLKPETTKRLMEH